MRLVLWFGKWLIFLGLVQGLMGHEAGNSLAAEKIRFGTVTRVIAVLVLPTLTAEEKGFWAKNGLEAKWLPFEAGTPLGQAMATRDVDLGMHSIPSVVLEVSRGVPEIMVAELGLRMDFFIFVLPKSPVREARDLKGLRVGLIRTGSVGHAFGQVMAKRLNMEKEIKYVALGGVGPLIAGLKSGVVDAGLSTFYSMASLKLRGELRDVVAMRDYVPPRWTDYGMISHVDFLREKEATVKKAVKAVLEAGEFILKNPDWSKERMKSLFGYSEPMAAAVYETFIYSKDGRIDPQAIGAVRDFLLEYGLVPREKVPSLEKIYTPRITG